MKGGKKAVLVAGACGLVVGVLAMLAAGGALNRT